MPVKVGSGFSFPYNNTPQLTSVFPKSSNQYARTSVSQNHGPLSTAYDYYDNDYRSVFATAKSTRRPRKTTTPFFPCALTLY